MHSFVHLVNDFKMFGCLEFVSCFHFESFLDELKSFVNSDYKSLQRVAFKINHKNKRTIKMMHFNSTVTKNNFLILSKIVKVLHD